MNTTIDNLRKQAYEHLVTYLHIERKTEIKNLVSSVVDKIDDENILRNLTYFKYALDPISIHFDSDEEEIHKYTDYNLCFVFLIIKATKGSKYRKSTPIEIIDEFCRDYEHKMDLDVSALYLINNFQLFYINLLCNEKDFLFNNNR